MFDGKSSPPQHRETLSPACVSSSVTDTEPSCGAWFAATLFLSFTFHASHPFSQIFHVTSWVKGNQSRLLISYSSSFLQKNLKFHRLFSYETASGKKVLKFPGQPHNMLTQHFLTVISCHVELSTKENTSYHV